MPRKTRIQLVGKQEDIEREAREAEIRDLAWELQVAWGIGGKIYRPRKLNLRTRQLPYSKPRRCP